MVAATFFLAVEYQLKIYIRKKDLWNHHLAIIIVIIESGKNHQCMLKLVGEVWWGTGHVHSVKVSPHKALVNDEGKCSNFKVEKM